MVSIDPEFRIVAANQAASRLFGSTTAELVGRSLLELVHPEDSEAVATQWAAAPSDEAFDLSCRIRGSDAVHRPLALRCTRDAASQQFVIAARETSSLEEMRVQRDDARRRLAALFETMHDMVYITDEQGVINGMNHPPPELSLSDIIGVPMLVFAAPEEQAPMRARYADVRERGKLVAYETVAAFADGTREIYSSRLGPIMDGNRSVGVVLITRNVTQERRIEAAKRYAEQQLREYMLQLERSNAELERFASIASHDLQEPLRKIQAFSDRLRERFREDLPETGRDYLDRIGNAAKRMQDLINDLLMFSRLSAKEQVFSPVHLGTIATNVLSDLEVRIEETGGKVIVGDLPTIDADPVHMRQLLQNMIGNALKFTRPDTPPVVTISAEEVTMPERDADNPATLRLTISDNGIGIEARHQDRIFGIFERLHSRAKYEGTGVGLAVCRKIVEQHSGSIALNSVVGQGTTFIILLPMKQPERGPQP
ncbi:MAG: PAS domain S-box protein [Nannocystis sp.]|nr:PAS domain S-box protein [Nannocystis sp.]